MITDLTAQQKDYARFLPALSGFYATYVGKQRFEETDPLQTAPGMHEDQLTRDSGLRGQPPLMLLGFLLGLLDLLLGLIELLLQQRALVQRVARRVDADPGRRRPPPTRKSAARGPRGQRRA